MRILTGSSPCEEIAPDATGRIILRCWQEYIIEADSELSLPASCVRRELRLSEDEPWRALVNFGDYLGLLWLGDQLVELRSSKLNAEGFDQLLQQITARVAALPFDFNSPSFVPFSRDALSENDLVYHAFVYLRWAMGMGRPSISESWSLIASDPHRILVREERRQSPWAARGVTPRTLEHICSHPESWAALDPQSPLMNTALARHLVDADGTRYFPNEVVEIVAETCLDTPENRFVKHFLQLAEDLARRAEVILALPEVSDRSLRGQAAQIARELRTMQAAEFLVDVGELRVLPAHSQVLQKRAGYREILHHYQALVFASKYPISATDLSRIIETKSASLLYEYWCFFELAEQLAAFLGRPTEASVWVDDLHAALSEGMHVTYEDGTELHYNRSFSRRNSRWRSYSVTLRPDIVLKLGDTLHLFDAKFRVEQWGVEELEDEVASADEDDRAQRATERWWKNADIHKMHAYKDALGRDAGQVQTVWVLYPGDKFVFYESAEGSGEGVGAVPLNPADLSSGLQDLLRALHSGQHPLSLTSVG